MQGHLKNVEDFHNTLKEFTDWLNNAETTMRTFKYPSKIVGKVQNQIEEHNVSAIYIFYTEELFVKSN